MAKDKKEEVTKEVEAEKVVELTKEQQLTQEVAELKDKLLRNAAELENFKKRVQDERQKERKYASMDVLGSLLNVLGSLDKAVNVEVTDDNLKNWLIGFKMINNQIFNVLEQEGVKLIETKDKMFDPNFHQSIEFALDETKEDGIILEEVSKGYMYKDRVLQYSMVKINKKDHNNL